MADNYLLFSEALANITTEEEAWLASRLDEEGAEHAAFAATAGDGFPAFQWEFRGGEEDKDESEDEEDEFEDGQEDDSGRYLLMYSDNGDVDQVARLVQAYLKQFHPDDYFALTYAETCDKPRVSEFGGGAVFVTATEIRWMNASAWVEAALDKHTKETPNDAAR